MTIYVLERVNSNGLITGISAYNSSSGVKLLEDNSYTKAMNMLSMAYPDATIKTFNWKHSSFPERWTNDLSAFFNCPTVGRGGEMKIFWFDTETTGLDSKVHDIVDLAVIVEIDGEVVEKRQWYIQPLNWDSISEEALEVNGLTVEKLKSFQSAKEVFFELLALLDKHIDKFDKRDKFIPAGQNVKFDTDFLREFFRKNNHKYYGSYFDYHYLDVMAIAMVKAYRNKQWRPENFKLESIARAQGINPPSGLHSAMVDIDLTREVFLSFFKR